MIVATTPTGLVCGADYLDAASGGIVHQEQRRAVGGGEVGCRKELVVAPIVGKTEAVADRRGFSAATRASFCPSSPVA